jgi:hypothetical protein
MNIVSREPESNAIVVANHQAMARTSAPSYQGLVLRTLTEMIAFADLVLRSKITPKGLDTVEAIVVALEFGAELGMAPMQSLQSVMVVGGRPGLYGDAALALCRSRGVLAYYSGCRIGHIAPAELR